MGTKTVWVKVEEDGNILVHRGDEYKNAHELWRKGYERVPDLFDKLKSVKNTSHSWMLRVRELEKWIAELPDRVKDVLTPEEMEEFSLFNPAPVDRWTSLRGLDPDEPLYSQTSGLELRMQVSKLNEIASKRLLYMRRQNAEMEQLKEENERLRKEVSDAATRT